MYKLYLTLDNEKGNKIERVIHMNENGGYIDGVSEVVRSMVDSMEAPFDRDEEITLEANRQVYNDKANS